MELEDEMKCNMRFCRARNRFTTMKKNSFILFRFTRNCFEKKEKKVKEVIEVDGE